MINNTKVIAIANHKGGVGKTTTTASIGSILSSMGKKVLMIDLDAQANLTGSFIKGEIEESIYHALTSTARNIEPVRLPIHRLSDNLHIVPASLQLAMIDIELSSAMSRESILKNILESMSETYDYILIDCPPSLALLTLNAMAAATEIIIPLTAETLPFNGLKMIVQFISTIQKRLNPNAHISGILITRWENTNLSRQIESGLRNNKFYHTFETKIRKNVSIAEAPLEAKNIVEYAPKSNGAKDYIAFTHELLKILE